MLKVNLHISPKLHSDLFIKIKENYILIVIKINSIDYLDGRLENLKKIQFQPSRIQISFFLYNIQLEKNIKNKIKKKIIKSLNNPVQVNFRALAKIIAPMIYPVDDYITLIRELSPITINEKDAVEIIKILTT